MTPRTVVIAHPERMMAEAVARAVDRAPYLVALGTATTAADAEVRGKAADTVALHAGIDGYAGLARRLRRTGTRVILMGADAGEDDGGVSVPMGASMDVLLEALVPGSAARPSLVAMELSKREREVLKLASRGMPGKQIARTLGISIKTVEQHKSRAFRKLGVPNQAAAISMLAGAEAAS
jgi:DNA-binding CsgD family transcriptional regulator